jgi:hypothetical protein
MADAEHIGSAVLDKEEDRRRRAKEADRRRKERAKAKRRGLDGGPPLLRVTKPRRPITKDLAERAERKRQINLEASAAYRARNAAKRKETQERYKERHREAIRARRSSEEAKRLRQERKTARMQRDVHYRLRILLSNRIGIAIRNGRAKKSARTIKLLGCSIADLMRHMERSFKRGMSWDNYGEWEIDHIRPCALFDLTDPEQQTACFHFTNLRPLWEHENRRKGAKRELLI